MVLSAGVVPRSELVAELVHRFGTARVRVQGTSMLPALRPGDEVELRSTAFNKINGGDIVAFRQAERLFVHRVIERGPNGLLTQGDALRQADVPVSSDQLLGVVVSVLRKGEQVRLQPSFAGRVIATLFSRSRMCAALFVKFASL
jgi:signal peptidase I